MVEVLGAEPPCSRCARVKEIVEDAASKFMSNNVHVRVVKSNIASREVLRKYGVLASPTITVNGYVKIKGRVPSEQEVEKLIYEATR